METVLMYLVKQFQKQETVKGGIAEGSHEGQGSEK